MSGLYRAIDRDIFHITFLWTFDKNIMRWYNTMDLRKLMN